MRLISLKIPQLATVTLLLGGGCDCGFSIPPEWGDLDCLTAGNENCTGGPPPDPPESGFTYGEESGPPPDESGVDTTGGTGASESETSGTSSGSTSGIGTSSGDPTNETETTIGSTNGTETRGTGEDLTGTPSSEGGNGSNQ